MIIASPSERMCVPMDTGRPYRPYLRRLTAYRSEPLYYTHVITFSPIEHSTGFHVHDRAELILAKSGTATITIESQVYRLKKNCLAIIRPNTLHRTTFDDNSPYERYDLQFDHTLLGNGVFDRIPKSLCFIDCNGNHTYDSENTCTECAVLSISRRIY